jgi:transcriptional regulator with XRE-family HTH domain
MARKLGLAGRGVNQGTVALVTGIARQRVNPVLNGRPGNVSPLQVRRILRAVDMIVAVPVEEFLRDREKILLRITRELDKPEPAAGDPQQVVAA